ncbi:hypothetical protein CDL15_Pgr013548 [Punica granatum]|uniref:Uncharacterized protein n=1 Tax=Punica granatum TaxID=22663 RepID=A0A218W245_PUNGR|nr:hypothetical protein CDL15_Pgr013548 [Punica granatum]PKI41604.1 hypothetical protein CRG98_038004 [Punica granatum]
MVLVNTTCIDCIDVHNPIKCSALRQRRWAEADAEFLQRMITASNKEPGCSSPSFLGSPSSQISENPESIHGEFASRQKYIRSYTFSKKGSKTKRWLQLKEKANSYSNIYGNIKTERPCSVLEAARRHFSCLAPVKVDVDLCKVL